MEQRIMPIGSAANFLGFSKSYVYKMVHLKKIPYFKPTNGRFFFKQSDLEAFLLRGRQSADYELEVKADGVLNARGQKI